MHYYQIENPGTAGWITYEDNEIAHIAQYPPDLWVTDNTAWAARVGATELTRLQAQEVCDNYINGLRAEWQACVSGATPWLCGPEPQYVILP